MTNDRRVSSLPLPFLVRALDCVVESVIITDAEGVVRSWNHAASLLYGFTSEEAIGRPIGELIVPVEGRDEALEAFQKIAADAGGAYTGGWDVQDRGGRRFPVVASTTVVLDPDGEPTHFIVSPRMRPTAVRPPGPYRPWRTSCRRHPTPSSRSTPPVW